MNSRRFLQCFRGYASLREKPTAKRIKPMSLVEPKFNFEKKYPEYEVVNIKLQSYDWSPLERFESYVHKTLRKLGLNIIETYPVPAKVTKVTNISPGTDLVEQELTLNYYTRVLRIGPVPTSEMNIIALLLQAHAPIGTQITMKEHEPADDDERYIPNFMLIAKEKELKLLDNPIHRRSLGWDLKIDEAQRSSMLPKKKVVAPDPKKEAPAEETKKKGSNKVHKDRM